MTTWRELCRELIDSRGPDYYRALERARKALADGSAAGDVAELVAALRHEAIGCTCTTLTSGDLRRAADLLERQAAPVPVAVSERLPGDALCWWYEPDEDDDLSGYGGCWTLLRIRGAVSFYTHWLPAHALPLPSGEVA